MKRGDPHRHTKDSMMTEMSDDISYLNVTDDVGPDPQIVFKDGDHSKYPAVVVKDHGKGKPGYLF